MKLLAAMDRFTKTSPDRGSIVTTGRVPDGILLHIEYVTTVGRWSRSNMTGEVVEVRLKTTRGNEPRNRLAAFALAGAASLAISTATGPGVWAAEAARQLLQAGIYQEEVRGDLEAAIRIFGDVLEQYPSDRRAAAQALLHMGNSYQKLGSFEARNAYLRLVTEYADQAAFVGVARRRLADLSDRGGGSMNPSFRVVLDSEAAGMPQENAGTLGWHRRRDVSQDGGRTVVATAAAEEGRLQGALFVVDGAGTVVRQLFHDEEHYLNWPRWSPDGKTVAYVGGRAREEDGDAIAETAIFVLALDDDAPRRVTEYRRGHHPYRWLRWTHAGDGLTFVNDEGIHVVDLAGRRTRHLAGEDLPGRFGWNVTDAELSPNGRWFAYCALSGDNTRMWLVPAAGGEAVPLRLPGQVNHHPAWSPDGRRVFYVASVAPGTNYANTHPNALGNLWVVGIDPRSGKQVEESRQLTFFEDTEIMFPRVVAEGESVAFDLVRTNSAILVTDGTAEFAPRMVANGGNQTPVLSPDGATLMYVHQGIKALELADDATRTLTEYSPETDGGYAATFDVSPDGRHIVYFEVQGQTSHLMMTAVADGESRALTSITGRALRPRWSPDGAQVAFSTVEGVLTVPVSGGPARLIGPLPATAVGVGGGYPVWSPDGRYIATTRYSAMDQDGDVEIVVYVLPATGGELRPIAASPHDLQGLAWHPEGDRLIYTVDKQASETRVAYLDGRPSTLMLKTGDSWNYVGKWRPGSREYYFMSGTNIDVYSDRTGATRRFAESRHWLSLPQWSRDGRRAAWLQRQRFGRETWLMSNFDAASVAAMP